MSFSWFYCVGFGVDVKISLSFFARSCIWLYMIWNDENNSVRDILFGIVCMLDFAAWAPSVTGFSVFPLFSVVANCCNPCKKRCDFPRSLHIMVEFLYFFNIVMFPGTFNTFGFQGASALGVSNSLTPIALGNICFVTLGLYGDHNFGYVF